MSRTQMELELHDDEHFVCYDCEDVYHVDDSMSFCDDLYCESCFNDRFFYCEVCGEATNNNYANSTNDGIICDNCFQSEYFRCESCNEPFHNDHGYCGEDFTMFCENCYSEESTLIDVKQYPMSSSDCKFIVNIIRRSICHDNHKK